MNRLMPHAFKLAQRKKKRSAMRERVRAMRKAKRKRETDERLQS